MTSATATRACPSRLAAGVAVVGLLTGCSSAGERAPTASPGTSGPSSTQASTQAVTPASTPATTTTPATATTADTPTADLIARVRLGEAEGGASYRVTPREALRDHLSTEALDRAWAEVAAAYPEADTDGLRDQFICHAYFATRKPTWNLEPWRADVTYLETVGEACNPPRAEP